LVTQAKRSFVNLLPDLSCTNLCEDKDNYTAHCVFSTYQTMMNCIDVIKDDTGKLFTSGHLRTNQPLTRLDIESLEKILWSEVGSQEDYEREYGHKPLGELVREIVGLDMNAAKEAFAEFLDDTNLDSRQIYFVNQIVEYIVHNGMMTDLSVLQESPFTDQGSVADIFTDLSIWAGIRKVIDGINYNAGVM
jgi:type I site-specific restriction endonuclease